MSYLQPMEGITATLRADDDLLSLADAAAPRREMMIAMGRHLWSMTLCAHQAPDGKEMFRRMNNPRVGDLVMENGRIDPIWGLGILLAHRDEWACSDKDWEQWQADEPQAYDGERPIERRVYYIQYGSDAIDICRWANASFIALPTERSSDWMRR